LLGHKATHCPHLPAQTQLSQIDATKLKQYASQAQEQQRRNIVCFIYFLMQLDPLSYSQD